MNTPEYKRFQELKRLAKRNHTKVPESFKNSALTVDGVLCIGMTLHQSRKYYSCTYTQLNGKRDFAGSHRWNVRGESLDGFSDLDIKTVQASVRTI